MFKVFNENFRNISDVCLTPNVIEDWKRSVGNDDSSTTICDAAMIHQWYRIKSEAGERMPTECPENGYRCGTSQPFWLTNSNYHLQLSLKKGSFKFELIKIISNLHV